MAEQVNDNRGTLADLDRQGRRAELIQAAQARWIAALTDLGGRNTLLYYKDPPPTPDRTRVRSWPPQS